MMTTTGNGPIRGPDGKYQIRIESYDPARNTMKAIWLVSRNQRLLSQLLTKCEATEQETSNETLRGNLLSVQKELQELRNAMDYHDGTQTPVVDTSALGMSEAFDENDSGWMNRWGESSITPSPVPTESLFAAERASSAFGFGKTKRRSVLSQIPRYSRPSIRTDFCVSSFEPFPSVRSRPSKLPKSPPVKKSKKAKNDVPRPRTSLSGRGTRLGSYSGKDQKSILKTSSSSNVRPATSMALTRSVTKKVSFGEPKERLNSCHSSTASIEMPPKPKSSNVRPSTSLGIRSIPRSSSRMSSAAGLDRVASRSGRESSMAPTHKRAASSGSIHSKPSSAATRTHQKSKSFPTSKKTTSSGTKTKHSADLLKKGPSSNNKPKKTSEMSVVQKPRPKSAGDTLKPVVRSRGLGSTTAKAKKTELKKYKIRTQMRPQSAFFCQPRMDVLPFESPPPVPQLLSQPRPTSSASFAESTGSSSPFIRSFSIIDDNSEFDDSIMKVGKSLPRLRLGEEPEYKVKAYFLDDIEDFPAPPELNSGVIPSSPVEVDSTSSFHPELMAKPVQKFMESTQTSSAVIPNVLQSTGSSCLTSEPIKETVSDSTAASISIRDHPISLDPDLGKDYLPEFESEVDGLLDTLMSQDLLTSTFSQDFRLFSTESNFMEPRVGRTEVDLQQKQSEQREDRLDSVDIDLKNTTEIEPQPSSTEKMSMSPVQEPQNHLSAENKHTEPVADSDSSHTENELFLNARGDVEDKLEFNDTDNVSVGLPNGLPPCVEQRSPRSEVVSRGIESSALGSFEYEKTKRTPIGDAFRRKSTGSYDATALSISIASALKPKRYRRSVSQTELDAVLTDNDGLERVASPGCSKQEGQREWNGRPSTELSIFEETCSMLSSSDLTIPDPCETYHDVHHGYTPSFATMATGSTFRQMDSISTSSPSVRMTSLHGGSFDFLGGFRSSMEETMNLKKFRRSISPIQTPSERQSTTRALSTNGEDLEEMEKAFPDAHPAVNKDRSPEPSRANLKWDERSLNKDQNDGRCKDNGCRNSAILDTVTLDTDEDTVEDRCGSSSGSLDLIKIEKAAIQSCHPSFNKTPKQKPIQKKWKPFCGFLRILKCSSSLNETDRA